MGGRTTYNYVRHDVRRFWDFSPPARTPRANLDGHAHTPHTTEIGPVRHSELFVIC